MDFRFIKIYLSFYVLTTQLCNGLLVALWPNRPGFGNKCIHKCLDGDNKLDILPGILTSDQIRVKTISWLLWDTFNIVQLKNTCSAVWASRECISTCLVQHDGSKPLAEVVKMVKVLEKICTSPLKNDALQSQCMRNSIKQAEEWCKNGPCSHFWKTSSNFLSNEDPLDSNLLIDRAIYTTECYCHCLRPSFACDPSLIGALQREHQAFEYINDIISQHGLKIPLVESCQHVTESAFVKKIQNLRKIKHKVQFAIPAKTNYTGKENLELRNERELFPIWAWMILLCMICAMFVVVFAFK